MLPRREGHSADGADCDTWMLPPSRATRPARNLAGGPWPPPMESIRLRVASGARERVQQLRGRGDRQGHTQGKGD